MTKKKNLKNAWLTALRIYNSENPTPSGFRIPKKGSVEYNEVQKIIETLDLRADIITVDHTKVIIRFE
jgi:hypothetical protein